MPKCSQCGKNVKKLTMHARTRELVCLRCVKEDGFLTLNKTELLEGNERRAHIRIPLTVLLDISLTQGKEKTSQAYQGYTVDISLDGLCFVWTHCTDCTISLKGRTISPDCIFYPYSLQHPEPKPLLLNLNISKNATTILEGFAIYTLFEKKQNIEYVGVNFANLTPQNRRNLEKLIIRYGSDN